MALLLAAFLWAVAFVTVGIFIARVWAPPELASVQGAVIDHQMALTLIISGAVFFLAQIGLGYLIWRYRARGTEPAANWHENPKMEVTWTLVTAIIFIALGIQGNRVWANYFMSEAPPDAMTIEVSGQQFAWNIRYPGPDGRFGRTSPDLVNDALGNYIGLDRKDSAGRDDIVSQNVMAVPVNRPVRVILRAKDVTHSFFVPQLRVKQDAVPGMAIQVHFTANKPGQYEIACAELCGMQHYKMRGRMLVMGDAELGEWLKKQAAF